MRRPRGCWRPRGMRHERAANWRLKGRGENEMSYGIEDARFDAEQQGRCSHCGRTWETGCRHCEDCGGRRSEDGSCPGCDEDSEVTS